MTPAEPPLHILILSARDWTHPQGGGVGANLLGHASRWLDWGHRVSVIAGGYPGGAPLERDGALTFHRLGTDTTVFTHAFRRQRRGLVPGVDVAFEMVSGIFFYTPLWLRVPRAVWLTHGHRDQFVTELGWKGHPAGWALETLPIRTIYRRSRFLCTSRATGDVLSRLGVPPAQIDVNYMGIEHGQFGTGRRAERPTLLYLGRLKRYKRVELLLDVLERVPGVELDVAGDGDHRPALEAEVAARGLAGRVRIHGHVSERRKAELLQAAWLNVTASQAEGWCQTVMEAAACSTPTAALAVGGLVESVEHGRTGLLAADVAGLAEHVRRVADQPQLRDRLGEAARQRAEGFTWERMAARTLAVLSEERRRALSPGGQPAAPATAEG